MGRIISLVIAALLVMLTPELSRAATLRSVISFDATLGQLPESIAADHRGNLYVSIGSTVVKVDDAGTASTLATLPVPAGTFATGVKVGPDGDLYVASGSLDPTLDVAALWRVSPITGDVNLVAGFAAGGFPNDIAFDRKGRVYVSDSFLGRIWRVDQSGAASVWLAHPALSGNPDAPVLVLHEFGANGLAFDARKNTLYVANLDYGAILRIPLRRDGSPGEVEVAAQSPLLEGADGIAFDRSGKLFVAVDWQQIATVDRRGNVEVVAAGAPLDGPSSLAFGVRACTVTLCSSPTSPSTGRAEPNRAHRRPVSSPCEFRARGCRFPDSAPPGAASDDRPPIVETRRETIFSLLGGTKPRQRKR